MIESGGAPHARVCLLCSLLLGLGAFGCGDDDGKAPDRGGARDAAADGASTSDSSASEADAGELTDSGSTEGIERDVLRPASREPTEALIAALQLPPGFKLGVYARGLEHARMLAVREGYVYVTRPMQGDVLRLRDTNGDGTAEERTTVASDLPDVHGIVFDGSTVYLAGPATVYRANVGVSGELSAPQAIIADLPAGGQHPYRTIGIGPDRKLYISIGSPCDACMVDDAEHATMLRAELDGTGRTVFATGLRNTIGFGWHPETNELWGMDHGSDWRGDDLPPEELNRIVSGKNYGWPYCYGSRVPDPVIQSPATTTKEMYCAATEPPVRTNQAHQAPIGWAFYTADQFPESYRNSAFVAFRGSWNRIPATGYKIARVVFSGGEPVGIEDFVTGFLIEAGMAEFARLAGVAVAPDGSLLFTDDEHGVIYRVHYDAGSP